MADKQIAAIIHYACPVCGKTDETQSAVALGKRLQDVSSLHNKTIDYGDPCADCKENMDKGIVLIECDISKTTDKNNPYRTGRMVTVTEDFIKHFIKEPTLSITLKKRAAFLPEEVFEQLGLISFFNSAKTNPDAGTDND